MAFPTIPTAAAGRVLTTTGLTCASGQTFGDLSSLTKNAGDLLIAIVLIYDGNSTNAEFSSWGGGFTEFGDFASTTGVSIGCAYKFSTGSETGTFTVTSSDTSTNDYATILLSIPGAHASAAPEAGGYATGTNSNADPGSITPSWGSDDNLWIAVCGVGETSTAGSFTGVIGVPSGYSDEAASGISADVVGGIEGSAAFLQNAAASEDPATFNTDTSNARWGAITIAVRPAAAGISASLTQTDATDTTSVASTLAIAGALSQSEAVDTSSAAAGVGIAASVSQAEAADTISSAAGAAPLTADADITEDADTVTATAANAIAASASVSEDADTVSAAATAAIAASCSQAEDADTISAAATLATAASVSATEDADTVSAAATLAIAASAAVTEDADTISSSGGTPALVADVAVTEDADSISADASLAVAASLAQSEEADTVSGAATLEIGASVSGAEAADTASASATLAIAASLAQSDGTDSSTSAAALAIAASSSVTEDADTISAAMDSGAPRTATLDIAEDGDSISASATIPSSDTDVSLPGPPTLERRRRRVRQRVADEWPITAKLHVVEQGDGCVAGATMGPTWQARQAVARLLLAA